MNCENCECNENVDIHQIPWHYRPRQKEIRKYGRTDYHTFLNVTLCEDCVYYALLSNRNLIGWDQMDAIDGLSVLIERGKEMTPTFDYIIYQSLVIKSSSHSD